MFFYFLPETVWVGSVVCPVYCKMIFLVSCCPKTIMSFPGIPDQSDTVHTVYLCSCIINIIKDDVNIIYKKKDHSS